MMSQAGLQPWLHAAPLSGEVMSAADNRDEFHAVVIRIVTDL